VIYHVFVTSRAKLQLSQCASWWAEHRSLEQAARWLDGFEQAIAALRHNPERHRLAQENDLYELPYPVRQLSYGIGKTPTHRAVFEIRGDTVFVVAIRHLAQDDLLLDDLG
jgi:plasmid stabilization system protein ParE